MAMPGFTGDASLYTTQNYYSARASTVEASNGARVVPQQCLSTGCVNLGGGQRLCVWLPILGTRCLTVPSFGRWRLRCCVNWTWLGPRPSCSLTRC